MAAIRQLDCVLNLQMYRLHVVLFVFSIGIATPGLSAEPVEPGNCFPGQALHLGFESEDELLADFVSQSKKYAPMGRDSLRVRSLAITRGRFGQALHIQDGRPISQGTWNESGLDCDLLVSVMWGEWHRKPHYWGTEAFHGDSGTVAFWVKSETLNPGIVFMQGSIAWGRMERDLFSIAVDDEGRLSAFIRDLQYRYHRVVAEKPTWHDNEWQHIAVVYDHAYGFKLYHNGVLSGTTWGNDAWWGTPQPGLFSPFLPESLYDEIYFFDRPLQEEEIRTLCLRNSIEMPAPSEVPSLEPSARERLLATYADLDSLELPTTSPGRDQLIIKQTRVEKCHDGHVPAWWVLDGRYELAWPHPYRLFTFILGDADFHGTKVDIQFPDGDTPNYIAFEGVLDGLKLLAGESNQLESGTELLHLNEYRSFFYSERIDAENATILHIPLVIGHGSPRGLKGSANVPLTGSTRIHEMQLWHVRTVAESWPAPSGGLTLYLHPGDETSRSRRYDAALLKITGSRDRTVVRSDTATSPLGRVRLKPLDSIHLLSPDLLPDTAIDSVGLRLLITPTARTDYLWIRLRDPANPLRIWAQTCVRLQFSEAGKPEIAAIVMDTIDLMLASEDRLLIDVTSANGGELIVGDLETPSTLTLFRSSDRRKSLAEYATHELLPARMQYMKEYNYKPWLFTGEKIDIRQWSHFGGPYDMVYPPQAVLRHDPSHPVASIYQTLTEERGRSQNLPAGGVPEPMVLDAPVDAPTWAIWERELYRLNREAAHWIVQRQRPDGMFWGGANDDSFIPLGYAGLPLLGDEIARKAWLRFYEGLEAMGIYADGYCDIHPIDPLHISDFITSRGLMTAYALGDPRVLERELRTAERYTDRVAVTDARRAKEGLPPLTGLSSERDDSRLVECLEAEIRNYSTTHLEWYWRRTEEPPPYTLDNRRELARSMMKRVQEFDSSALFGLTEAMTHTDNQNGVGRNELIAAALGGRLQGRFEPHPHSIAVSWEGADSIDLARLVSHASTDSLSVNLYNFGNESTTVSMRFWRLSKGLYEIAQGSDNNDDGRIDANDDDEIQKPVYADGTKQQQVLRRFSMLPLEIPPRRNIVVTVTQIEELREADNLPDLAITERDLRVSGDNTLEVTVHNVGAAPARHIVVEVLDADARIVAVQTIEELGTPIEDLAAHRTTLTFEELDNPSELGIRVDRGDKIEEILEENNDMPAK